MQSANGISLETAILWAKKGGWSLADQWIFSGANVIANILLARWLSVDDYGIFAMAFSIFLFTVAIHTALIVEPMLVLGAGRLSQYLKHYFRFLFGSHVAISLLGTILLSLLAWVLGTWGSSDLSTAILIIAVGLPMLLLPWFARRAFYLKARSDWATLCSSIYLVVLLGSVALQYLLAQLTVVGALIAFGLASAASAIPLFSFYGQLPNDTNSPDLANILGIQWDYAKWSGPAAVLLWIPLNLFYLVLPYSGGLQAAATLKAFSNILNPLSQSTQALIALLLPQLSGVFAAEGKTTLRHLSRRIQYVFVAASVIFWVLLAVLRRPLLDLLYAGAYTHSANLLLLAGAIPILMGLTAILATELRATEQPKLVFISYAAGALIATTLGILLTFNMGLSGTLVGQAIAYLGMAVTLSWLLRNR